MKRRLLDALQQRISTNSNRPNNNDPTFSADQDNSRGRRFGAVGQGATNRRIARQRLRPKLSPGQVINEKYIVIREVGAGGFGSVYLVENLQIGTQRVLKVYQREADKVIGSPLMEGQVLARLSGCRNVVRADDVIAIDGYLGLIMEWFDGDSLDKHVASRLPNTTDVLRILLQVIIAIRDAHACGVIHRDIKPENILIKSLDETIDVRVIDFGISALLGESPDCVVGTPGWMAPEQHESVRQADHRVDVWGIGAVLHAMLVGGPPIMDERRQLVLPLALEPAFAEVLRATLAWDPASRPGNCDELLQILEQSGLLTLERKRSDLQPESLGVIASAVDLAFGDSSRLESWLSRTVGSVATMRWLVMANRGAGSRRYRIREAIETSGVELDRLLGALLGASPGLIEIISALANRYMGKQEIPLHLMNGSWSDRDLDTWFAWILCQKTDDPRDIWEEVGGDTRDLSELSGLQAWLHLLDVHSGRLARLPSLLEATSAGQFAKAAALERLYRAGLSPVWTPDNGMRVVILTVQEDYDRAHRLATEHRLIGRQATVIHVESSKLDAESRRAAWFANFAIVVWSKDAAENSDLWGCIRDLHSMVGSQDSAMLEVTYYGTQRRPNKLERRASIEPPMAPRSVITSGAIGVATLALLKGGFAIHSALIIVYLTLLYMFSQIDTGNKIGIRGWTRHKFAQIDMLGRRQVLLFADQGLQYIYSTHHGITSSTIIRCSIIGLVVSSPMVPLLFERCLLRPDPVIATLTGFEPATVFWLLIISVFLVNLAMDLLSLKITIGILQRLLVVREWYSLLALLFLDVAAVLGCIFTTLLLNYGSIHFLLVQSDPFMLHVGLFENLLLAAEGGINFGRIANGFITPLTLLSGVVAGTACFPTIVYGTLMLAMLSTQMMPNGWREQLLGLVSTRLQSRRAALIRAACVFVLMVMSHAVVSTVEDPNVALVETELADISFVASPLSNTVQGGFWEISTTELTQSQWDRVWSRDSSQATLWGIPQSPSVFVGLNFPVDTVTICDTLRFLNHWSITEGLEPMYTVLTKHGVSNDPSLQGCESGAIVVRTTSRRGYRLPTQSERDLLIAWEGWLGPIVGEPRCVTNSRLHSWPVRSGERTPSGLYDLVGGVSEWIGPGRGEFSDDNVFCGGSWLCQGALCRADRCYQVHRPSAYDGVGFRPVRETKGPTESGVANSQLDIP
ncbi:MAG: protein kinase [Alphaproteobacteria bacterium]|nr:protein kinase [Alphaproteobacteria bacterium]